MVTLCKNLQSHFWKTKRPFFTDFIKKKNHNSLQVKVLLLLRSFLAESEGFEPPEQLPVHRISSAARSTTPATFLTFLKSGAKVVNYRYHCHFASKKVFRRTCQFLYSRQPYKKGTLPIFINSVPLLLVYYSTICLAVIQHFY